jgi:hypothetical protein
MFEKILNNEKKSQKGCPFALYKGIYAESVTDKKQRRKG